MRKNVASQVVCAQLNSRTDGSPVTSGTTTVYVLGDGGTQGTGSVSSGAATHEGHGLWSYAPAQSETNYDNVCFTFENSNAVSATIQIYTSFPQTVDNASNISAIKTKTDFLPSATAGSAGGVFIAGTNAATTITTGLTTTFTGNLTGSVASVTGAVGSVTGAVGSVTGSVGSVASGGITAASFASDAITAAKIAADVTTELQAGLATSSALSTAQTDITAIKGKTDQFVFTVANQVDANALAADVTKVNGITVGGSGTTLDPWGPA